MIWKPPPEWAYAFNRGWRSRQVYGQIPRELTDARALAALEAHEAGMTYAQIAKELGCLSPERAGQLVRRGIRVRLKTAAVE
jgi:hypothetical protein